MVSFLVFYEVPPYLRAVQSAHGVVLEQNKHVLLSVIEILYDERYNGAFLGKFLNLPRQYVS